MSEIDRIEQACTGCKIRAHYNNLKDIAGLSNACKVCPVFEELSQYGEQLLGLTNPRK